MKEFFYLEDLERERRDGGGAELNTGDIFFEGVGLIKILDAFGDERLLPAVFLQRGKSLFIKLMDDFLRVADIFDMYLLKNGDKVNRILVSAFKYLICECEKG